MGFVPGSCFSCQCAGFSRRGQLHWVGFTVHLVLWAHGAFSPGHRWAMASLDSEQCRGVKGRPLPAPPPAVRRPPVHTSDLSPGAFLLVSTCCTFHKGRVPVPPPSLVFSRTQKASSVSAPSPLTPLPPLRCRAFRVGTVPSHASHTNPVWAGAIL